MSEREFEIDDKKFKLSKINAMKQFHIVRRIGPILSELLPAMQGLARPVKGEDDLDKLSKFANPIINGLSKLSDQDSDFVLYGLLNSVEMNLQGFWSKVANEQGLMIQNLELPILLQLAVKAFGYNLSGFFPAASPK